MNRISTSKSNFTLLFTALGMAFAGPAEADPAKDPKSISEYWKIAAKDVPDETATIVLVPSTDMQGAYVAEIHCEDDLTLIQRAAKFCDHPDGGPNIVAKNLRYDKKEGKWRGYFYDHREAGNRGILKQFMSEGKGIVHEEDGQYFLKADHWAARLLGLGILAQLTPTPDHESSPEHIKGTSPVVVAQRPAPSSTPN